MNDGWIVIPNWEKWQSRRDRHDPWIKDWIDQLDRDEHLSLTLAERGLIADIRRAYSRHNGQLRANMLPGLIQARVRIDQLERLRNAGLLVTVAAKPPPIGGGFAARAGEEKEKEKETPKPPFTNNQTNQPTCPNCGAHFKGQLSLAEHLYHSHDGPEPAHWLEAEARTRTRQPERLP